MSIFCLLVAFQLKHFIADYPLQTPYMLQKFKADWGFLGPLAAHCTVHSMLTWMIVNVAHFWMPGITYPMAFGVTAFDFVIHFTMDRIKASPKMLGRYKCLAASEFPPIISDANSSSPTAVAEAKRKLRGNKLFWWSLGLDQMVHHLTHYAIIWILVTA